MIWTARQRVALTIIMAALLLFLAVRYAGNRAYVSDPQEDEGPRAGQILGRVDPNTADWPALAALPVIGKSIAERIVAEREAFRAARPGEVAYRRIEDLLRVKGIGQATIEALEPYLVFPGEDRPATQP